MSYVEVPVVTQTQCIGISIADHQAMALYIQAPYPEREKHRQHMQALDFPDFPDFPLAALRELLDARRVSSVELARACIARTQAQAGINAWVDFQPQAFLSAAQQADKRLAAGERLPLLGIPVALKDNIEAAGFACAAGTKALAGYRPKSDAAVVARLKAAGAMVAGKLGMHELALGISSNNAVTGAVRNPWHHDYMPGGSSGGSGAAAAARLVPVVIGTDTGGSVRVPAALCGVTGFRPSVGRWPTSGIIPISHTRDTPGPLAHTVADCALLDAIVTGKASGEIPAPLPKMACKGLRLGVPRLPFWQDLEPALQTLAEQALERLAAAGMTLVEFDLPELPGLSAQAGFPIALYEFEHDMRACLQRQSNGITLATLLEQVGSPDVQAVLADLRAGKGVPEQDYQHALKARARLQQRYAQAFASHRVDALVFPTTPRTAARIGEDDTVLLNGRRMPAFATFIRNTDPGSIAALPGVSIPVGLVGPACGDLPAVDPPAVKLPAVNLPAGLALDGPAHSDRRLLAIALAVQSVLPPPPRLPLSN